MDNLLENELLGKTLHPGTDYQAEKKIKNKIETIDYLSYLKM